jgi:hypothetical protein
VGFSVHRTLKIIVQLAGECPNPMSTHHELFLASSWFSSMHRYVDQHPAGFLCLFLLYFFKIYLFLF